MPRYLRPAVGAKMHVFVAREHKSRALQQHREGKGRGEKEESTASPLHECIGSCMQHGSTAQCLVEEEGDRLNVATKTKKPDELCTLCARVSFSELELHSHKNKARPPCNLSFLPDALHCTANPQRQRPAARLQSAEGVGKGAEWCRERLFVLVLQLQGVFLRPTNLAPLSSPLCPRCSLASRLALARSLSHSKLGHCANTLLLRLVR